MPKEPISREDLLRIIDKAARQRATSLDLSYKGITDLPPEITGLSNLTELWLDANDLSSLSPEIARLSKLTVLWLAGNQLTSLPPEIARLSNLTCLNLHSNKLSSLPREIGNLSSLRRLHLSNNRLSAFPRALLDLPLPVKWHCQPGESGISCADNPWQSPPRRSREAGQKGDPQLFRRAAGQADRLPL